MLAGRTGFTIRVDRMVRANSCARSACLWSASSTRQPYTVGWPEDRASGTRWAGPRIGLAVQRGFEQMLDLGELRRRRWIARHVQGPRVACAGIIVQIEVDPALEIQGFGQPADRRAGALFVLGAEPRGVGQRVGGLRALVGIVIDLRDAPERLG